MQYILYVNHVANIYNGGERLVHRDVLCHVDENEYVCMTTYKPVTFISAGNEHTTSAGDKVTFHLDKDIYLHSISDPKWLVKVRVVKADPPTRSPTPEEQDRAARLTIKLFWGY
jgi:hypothetical protein